MLVWLLRHPLFAGRPRARGGRGAHLGRRSPSGYGAGRAGGGAAGVVAGAPRLVRPVGRPPAPLDLAALDGLPGPTLGSGCSTTASSPATTAAPGRPVPPRPAGPLGDPVDRHPRGADGPRTGPALLDRPHPRPRRRPARRTGRGHPPPPRRADRDRGAAQPVPARPGRHPHPRHRRRGRPVAARRRGQRVRRPVPAEPARQAPARRRRLRRRQVLAAVEPAARGRADDPRRPAPGVDDRPEGRHRDRPRAGPVPPLGHHPRRRPRPAHRVPRLHARTPTADARASGRGAATSPPRRRTSC